MPRRVGAYGKLLANYASDDAIIAAGEAAELLFCRAIAFLSTSDSDGFFTETQMERYIGAGLKNVRRRADALVNEGLWVRVDGGYQVRSWTRINETAEERGRKLRTDRERKRLQHPTGLQADSARNPDGVRDMEGTESLKYTVVTEVGKKEVQSSQAEQPPRQRGTRLEPDWKPNDDDLAWQRAHGISDTLARREQPRFVDYWIAKPGRDGIKLDWSATWRNWLRRTIEREPVAAQQGHTSHFWNN
jgi:hypothetical protein